MELNQEKKDTSFINHVFSNTDEDKAEMLNVIQYGLMAIIPVIVLNKLIHRFIPEADPDKSSLELLVEMAIQIVLIFVGLILIHRIITYFPTYSGFKYENLTLTNIILAFLVIVLSIQSKLGLKGNILFDRVMILWNGPTESTDDEPKKKSRHNPSRADDMDNSHIQHDIFPPAPVATTRPNSDHGVPEPSMQYEMGPMAANSILGGAFGSSF
jgi:small-conductance mechanosensitive channel